MSILAVVLTLVLLAAVIVVISGPLRATKAPAESNAPERAELEVARESKYREIRDAELDFRTGKLSREDYEAVNGALRAEAVAILDRLDALGERDEQEEQASGRVQREERAQEQQASGRVQQEERAQEEQASVERVEQEERVE